VAKHILYIKNSVKLRTKQIQIMKNNTLIIAEKIKPFSSFIIPGGRKNAF
jgi:cob(I)alamin adenosyltransferase